MDQPIGALRMPGASGAPHAPIQDFLAELHARVSQMSGGKVADYIPELGKADPASFGIAIATVDGQVYEAGDAELPFAIQSVSKPFMYGHALQHYGRQRQRQRADQGSDPDRREEAPHCHLGPRPHGEMALLDRGARSADVIADERVVCYGVAIEPLQELAAAYPNIMVTILANLTREFSERLRHANEAIRTLE